MGRRIAMVAGVIALAGVLVLVIPGKQAPSITLQVLGATNSGKSTFRLVKISNSTAQAYTLRTWTEGYDAYEGKWEKAHLGGGNYAVSPKSAIIEYAMITSRDRHRLVVVYHAEGGWRAWIRHLRTLMGIKPLPEPEGGVLHVELE